MEFTKTNNSVKANVIRALVVVTIFTAMTPIFGGCEIQKSAQSYNSRQTRNSCPTGGCHESPKKYQTYNRR